MSQTIKGISTYLFLILLTLGCIRTYDYVTKDPSIIERTENPEIIRINKRQDSILLLFKKDIERGDSAFRLVILRLDSMKYDHKKSNDEHKKLKAIPDSSLIYYRDSIRKSNGL